MMEYCICIRLHACLLAVTWNTCIVNRNEDVRCLDVYFTDGLDAERASNDEGFFCHPETNSVCQLNRPRTPSVAWRQHLRSVLSIAD